MPTRHRDVLSATAAGLTRDAMLLGMGSHFELWDKTTYDAKEAEAIQAGMTQAFEELVF